MLWLGLYITRYFWKYRVLIRYFYRFKYRAIPDTPDICPMNSMFSPILGRYSFYFTDTKVIKAISHIKKVLETSKIEIEYMNRRMHAFWVAHPAQIRSQMARQWVNLHQAT
jgi:hypothetical protein